jgi:hypothetical protein
MDARLNEAGVPRASTRPRLLFSFQGAYIDREHALFVIPTEAGIHSRGARTMVAARNGS